MKDKWWFYQANCLQKVANNKDIQAFYQELKAVHGPNFNSVASVHSADGNSFVSETNTDSTEMGRAF